MEDLLPQAYQTSEESPKCPAIAPDFKSLGDSFHPLGLQIDKGTDPTLSVHSLWHSAHSSQGSIFHMKQLSRSLKSSSTSFKVHVYRKRWLYLAYKYKYKVEISGQRDDYVHKERDFAVKPTIYIHALERSWW